MAGLVHPHVVTVHNLGSDRGYHYIEMEYVPGGVSLKETAGPRGAFEPIRATTLVRQVVLALGAAHRSGLVHRDVKPSNVLLTADGQAKLADFGLVRGHPSRRAGRRPGRRHAHLHGPRAVRGRARPAPGPTSTPSA